VLLCMLRLDLPLPACSCMRPARKGKRRHVMAAGAPVQSQPGGRVAGGGPHPRGCRCGRPARGL
jgi:hypothetical protein